MRIGELQPRYDSNASFGIWSDTCIDKWFFKSKYTYNDEYNSRYHVLENIHFRGKAQLFSQIFHVIFVKNLPCDLLEWHVKSKVVYDDQFWFSVQDSVNFSRIIYDFTL